MRNIENMRGYGYRSGRCCRGGRGCYGNDEDLHGNYEGRRMYMNHGMWGFGRYNESASDMKERLMNYKEELEEEIKYIDSRIKELEDASNSKSAEEEK
ncbi:MAG: hypothetical protein ACP5RP_02825 [Candidatus Micrarchaeia archaeon]